MADSKVSATTSYFPLDQDLKIDFASSSGGEEASEEEPDVKRIKLQEVKLDPLSQSPNQMTTVDVSATDSASIEDRKASPDEVEVKEEDTSAKTNKKQKRKRKPQNGDGSKTCEKSKPGTTKKKKKKKSKPSNLRKNIRDIYTATQLDAETLEAQKAEQERRARQEEKKQQLQQENLMKILNATTTPSFLDELIPTVQPLPQFPEIPRDIDEVVILSSDDEVADDQKFDFSNTAFGSAYGGNHAFLGMSGGTVYSPSEAIASQGAGVLDDDGNEKVGSDDDDCIRLSPSAYEDELDVEVKDDANNVLDEFGRVLVNVAHPSADPDIFLAPQVAKIIKPHQIGGIRFLYDNVVESVERFNTSNGFGCILAHSMGLGKTIQAVSFCDIFLRHTKAKNVLIIVPINTIQNWLNEFNYWVPPEENVTINNFLSRRPTKPKTMCSIGDDYNQDATDSQSGSPQSSVNNGSDKSLNSDIRPRSFEVFVLNETVKTLKARERIIRDWKTKGGVLLLGYEMYRMLALKRLKRSIKKKQPSINLNEENEETSLDNIYHDIVDPGPDLVICDEGHRIKNSGASISQALKAIKTKRRVVLTGYPLQNNLMEYWCMVDFVRPNYLGSKTEFANMFERPITNGQCVDSSVADRKLMKYRSHVLHTLLEGFVQRRSHVVLQCALPPKSEWVFLLKLTSIQYSLYKEFIRYLREERPERNSEGQSSVNPIKAFAVCCKIWNHPDALYNVVKKHDDVLDDLDLDDVGDDKKPGRKPRKKVTPKLASSGFKVEPQNFDFEADFQVLGLEPDLNIPTTVSQHSLPSTPGTDGRTISLDWSIPVFKDYQAEVLENGVKFQLLLAVVEETETAGDKLLVFSQSLLTLDLMELFLSKRLGWQKNVQYFRLDGSTSGLEREKLVGEFNTKESVRVFLVSTRAGSLGINLIGANRVIVFDASWNPCHDAQAVCRVYRYGQQKQCQIYRFVTDYSLEKRIYDRQINKKGMADRVVDEMNPETQLHSKEVSSFLVLDENQMDAVQLASQKFDIEKFDDPVLKRVLERCGACLTKEPFEHESLLVDRKETKLSAKEKREARTDYEKQKKIAGNQGYTRQSYRKFYDVPVATNSTSYIYDTATSIQSPSSVPSSLNQQFKSVSYDLDSAQSSPSAPTASTDFKKKMQQLYQIKQQREREKSFPYQELQKRGVDCRFMILKKDAYIQDPSSGTEIFLKQGEKINIFRSCHGVYVQIANGRIIAIRPTHADTPGTVRGIPLTGEVPMERLQSLVFSLLRPANTGAPAENPYRRKTNGSYGLTGVRPGYDTSRPYPAYQQLPPTRGLFPSSSAYSTRTGPNILRSSQQPLTSEQVFMNVKRLPATATRTADSDDDIEVIAVNPGIGQINRRMLDNRKTGESLTSISDRLTPPDMSITALSNNTSSGSGSSRQAIFPSISSISSRSSSWTSPLSGQGSILSKQLLGNGTSSSASTTPNWNDPSYLNKLKDLVASSRSSKSSASAPAASSTYGPGHQSFSEAFTLPSMSSFNNINTDFSSTRPSFFGNGQQFTGFGTTYSSQPTFDSPLPSFDDVVQDMSLSSREHPQVSSFLTNITGDSTNSSGGDSIQ